jgi:hypothetical protein
MEMAPGQGEDVLLRDPVQHAAMRVAKVTILANRIAVP